MPKTTYALLKSIRSHRIETPSVATAMATGRPTACNLCHLDRSLAWTAAQLETRWKLPAPTLDPSMRDVPVAAWLALRGDAAMRALVAEALSDPDARAASGSDWQNAVLSDLEGDDYAAVAAIAQRSRAMMPPSQRELVDPLTRSLLLAQRDRRAITISE